MTIEELQNANKDMGWNDICVVRSKYENSQHRDCIDDIFDGCVIYKDGYFTMPKVIRGLNVMSFKCTNRIRSLDKPSEWEIWVV